MGEGGILHKPFAWWNSENWHWCGMKILVFAHVPPPLHGQSQMVQYLIEGLNGHPELGVEIVHVDARLSEDLQDVGSARSGKLRLLLRYCIQALKARRVTGVRVLYYVPSPPKRNSLYRDWLVLGCLRPWFPKVIFHWHAVGLGRWVREHARPWERWLTRRILGRVDASIVLSSDGEEDAGYFLPDRIFRVSNGIADPFPDYDERLSVLRVERMMRRRNGEVCVRVLFMALCSEDKGVLDAVRAVSEAQRIEDERGMRADGGQALQFVLDVAGTFPDGDIEMRFHETVSDLGMKERVRFHGFVSGDAKRQLLTEADLFLFPTYYKAEGQPLSVMEACGSGLPVISTDWRGIPGMFWEGYDGLTPPRDVARMAEALIRLAREGDPSRFRRHFEKSYSVRAHCRAMARVFAECQSR